MTEVTSWGNNLKTIGYGAFMQSKLTAITLPNSLETIADSAFKQTKLTSLNSVSYTHLDVYKRQH